MENVSLKVLEFFVQKSWHTNSGTGTGTGTGCKESQFYSLLFGQAIVSMH